MKRRESLSLTHLAATFDRRRRAMFPFRNNFGFRGQPANFMNGFRFQGPPLPFNPGSSPNMGWYPTLPLQHFGTQGYNPGFGGGRNMNQRGKKRQMPIDRNQSSKRARPSDDTPHPDLKRYKVPISHGTEKITTSIWEYFLNHQMSDNHLKQKLKLRKCLHTIFEGSFPGCRLFIVGSSMTGFATKSSDVDMCLMLSEKEINQKTDASYILSLISRALRQCSFVRSAQVIRARVPILKFEDCFANVECDLNINNTIGIRNTHLLRHYAHMDWRVRPLMLFIKHWARFHDINDASKKTISSYSLSLMLIHYLQVGITPPVLPCLQKMSPEVFSDIHDVRNLSLSMEEKVEFTSENAATLGELFLGFLNYYGNMFNYSHVISIRLGKQLSPRECNLAGITLSDNDWKSLRIEEPFSRTNTAGSVYDSFVFQRIMRVFQRSFTTLERTRQTDSILSLPF